MPKVTDDTLHVRVDERDAEVRGVLGDRVVPRDRKLCYHYKRWLDDSQRTGSGTAERTTIYDRDGTQHGGTPWYNEVVKDPETGEKITDKHQPLRSKPPSGSAKPRK